ncbi:MAG: class I SAM-dependent methyltransferase [Oligoflexia bacterium]|nr:class I SAM-dependent methyltransferase [Oligoflexia bacterium]
MKKEKYLHGYSQTEQARLYDQAKFLEPHFYDLIDFRKSKSVLEIGCGVGAQTKILLKKFPHIKISAVDRELGQILQARKYLANYIKKDKVELHLQDALNLTLDKKNFDGAFIMWFLEHVPSPLKALKEIKKHLKPGGTIFCTEVQNASFFLEPHSPAIIEFWNILNEVQVALGGDPYVGAKLGNLLQEAKYKDIQIHVKPFYFDARTVKQRKEFIEYWTGIMLSAIPAMKSKKRISSNLFKQMKKEVMIIKKSKQSVFYYTAVQAVAKA